jgi:hypothetical protein
MTSLLANSIAKLEDSETIKIAFIFIAIDSDLQKLRNAEEMREYIANHVNHPSVSALVCQLNATHIELLREMINSISNQMKTILE